MTNETDGSIGDRIRRYRSDAGLSLSQLSMSAGVSKGYLWSLENVPDKRPSAQTLYAIATALGVTMSSLLGRRLLTNQPTDIPESLQEFADAKRLPDSDVRMLAGIEFRGVRPQTRERWEHIYNAIRMSRTLDE
ncbi:MAG: helix-turn-helix transcriptional regulator [bacterium]|nr:helix-turn-helix transcriptional regulator [bacterium]MDE0351161.1 helix-turn-helix transcriptional regulator [bacterium]